MIADGEKEDTLIRAQELATDILVLSRNQLLVNLRYMDRAVANIGFIPELKATFVADGRNILYSPWFVINMYQTEPTAVTRNLLHSILHCVFRHYFVGKEIDKNAWNLACDIAVENAINELSQPMLDCRRMSAQQGFTTVLKQELPALTAERIYRWLLDKKIPDAELIENRIPFTGDDHSIWFGTGHSANAAESDIDLNELWEKISKRMETELELVIGDDSALTQNLRDINRVKHDYTEFLRHFGVHGEVMKLSDEEFDNNYYTYGLELYGNIPLIEPLEYRDQNKIRDFVIAIDTSGSVEGEVVQKFVQHTHDILAKQESFSTRVNMYIIQCDDRIRDAAYITCKEDFDRYLKEMEIKGLGETDFRPVFAYVDELVAQKKLTDLRGVLYFTDGKGTFPGEKPDYDVAFIIHDDGLSDVWTPDWAMKLYLAEEDILNDRFGR
ncbi:MAG: VWA-like domain-containing protein [Lachnospiraceae bacterium]|nr:VWA-like domain-containing protein [Lachnospiraceae bacterium]